MLVLDNRRTAMLYCGDWRDVARPRRRVLDERRQAGRRPDEERP
jgi:hypothetical protein